MWHSILATHNMIKHQVVVIGIGNDFSQLDLPELLFCGNRKGSIVKTYTKKNPFFLPVWTEKLSCKCLSPSPKRFHMWRRGPRRQSKHNHSHSQQFYLQSALAFCEISLNFYNFPLACLSFIVQNQNTKSYTFSPFSSPSKHLGNLIARHGCQGYLTPISSFFVQFSLSCIILKLSLTATYINL